MQIPGSENHRGLEEVAVAEEGSDSLPNTALRLSTNSSVHSIRGSLLPAGACASALTVGAVRGG